jgi:cell surface protein SprA
VTYGLGKGMMIPGFRPNSQYIGGDWDEYGGEGAPGLGFLFGKQTDFGGEQGNQFWEYASEKEWLVRNPNINNQVSRLSSNRLTLRATAEPIKDLRINFSGSYNNTQNTVMFYRYGRDSLSNEWGWREQSPVTSGNYSVSYNMIRTSLVTDDEETNGNVIFDNMLEYRELMSDRVAQNSELSEFIQGEHEKYPGYAQGYGPTSADVLIPAFLAAYSGKDPNLQKLNVLDELPKVNWRVTYNGLSKIPALKKYFKTVTTSTGYTSNLTVGGYTNNQRYKTSDEVSEELQRQQLDDIIERDLDSNFIGKYQFNSVTLSEQFSPLVNVDFQWKNGISTRVEYKTGRTAALNVGTGQIMEQKNKTYTIGAGYSFPLSLPWSINGKKLNSDLKLRADGSYRENRAIVRRIAENEHTPTSGQNVFSLKITADYALSTNLNLRLFYDYVLNIPVISNSFRTANTNFGVSFRFTIG